MNYEEAKAEIFASFEPYMVAMNLLGFDFQVRELNDKTISIQVVVGTSLTVSKRVVFPLIILKYDKDQQLFLAEIDETTLEFSFEDQEWSSNWLYEETKESKRIGYDAGNKVFEIVINDTYQPLLLCQNLEPYFEVLTS